MSNIQTFIIKTGEQTSRTVTVTNQRTQNDFNGNPQCLIQVWTSSNNGHIWYPKLKAFRERKDNSYKMQVSNTLEETSRKFIKYFETSLFNK